MSSSAVFWAHNFGWFLFVGFLVFAIVTGSAFGYITSDTHASRISAKRKLIMQRREHAHEKELLRMKLDYAASGKVDHEYLAYLDSKNREGGQLA